MKNTLKTMLTGIAVVLLLGTAAVSTLAAEGDLTVKVGGQVVDFPDQEPTIKNDRTLVPVRFVAEALGYDVDWNPDTRSVIIDGGRIVMTIDSQTATIDGKNVTLDVSPTIINERTMVPLRVVAETLDCTVDWFGTNRMILVNKRDANGKEMSLFQRYRQSELFWEYSTEQNNYLVWKADYPTLEEASSPHTYHSWWIEEQIDRSTLDNQSFDCSIIMKTFNPEELANVRDMLYAAYPTESAKVYDIMMDTITGEIWETFYKESSEFYPLYSAMPANSGTFGTRYCDNRELEMYCNETCTKFIMNFSQEGYVNPETPRELSQDEIDFYTEKAKNFYCLGLWGLE